MHKQPQYLLHHLLIGVPYAEGFMLDGTIQIDDPINHFAHTKPAVLFQDESERR